MRILVTNCLKTYLSPKPLHIDRCVQYISRSLHKLVKIRCPEKSLFIVFLLLFNRKLQWNLNYILILPQIKKEILQRDLQIN